MQIETSRLDGMVLFPPDRAVRAELPKVVRFRNWRLTLDDAESAIALVHGAMSCNDDGRYVVRDLEIQTTHPSGAGEAPGVTHDLLRAVPLSRIVMDVIRETHPRVVYVDAENHSITVATTDDLSDDEQLVALYWIARAARENTNHAIADALKITPAAAAQRVARLRKKEPPWLPPARTQGARR